MCTLLPMVYLKISLLGNVPETNEWASQVVDESDYEFVRRGVANIMGEYDDYLDVYVEDFKYSDQPVLRTVSEGLADVYQMLRELVEPFRQGDEELMAVKLCEAIDAFKNGCGQTLLSTLCAIHSLRYQSDDFIQND